MMGLIIILMLLGLKILCLKCLIKLMIFHCFLWILKHSYLHLGDLPLTTIKILGFSVIWNSQKTTETPNNTLMSSQLIMILTLSASIFIVQDYSHVNQVRATFGFQYKMLKEILLMLEKDIQQKLETYLFSCMIRMPVHTI